MREKNLQPLAGVNKARISSFIFLISFFYSSQIALASANVQTGQSLFFQYCTPCHQVDGKLIGPPLREADKRRPEAWLLQWVRNNQALRASGDKDAIALFNGYNVEMPAFTNFSDDQIRSIMAYVDSRPVQVLPPIPMDNATTTQFYLLYVVIGFFLIIIFFLLRTNFLLVHHLHEVMHENEIKTP